MKSLTCILKSEGSKHDFRANFFYFFPFLIIPRTINILNVCSKFESHLLSYMYKQDTEFEIIFYGNKVKSLLLCCSSLKFNQMLLFLLIWTSWIRVFCLQRVIFSNRLSFLCITLFVNKYKSRVLFTWKWFLNSVSCL